MNSCRFPKRSVFCRLTVRKEGPNTGREFYSCPKAREESCKFFKWADEDPDSNPGDGAQATRGGYRGGGGGSARGGGVTRGGGAGTAGKRKCGQCRQEG